MTQTKIENSAVQLASASNIRNIWGDIIYNVKAYGAKGNGTTNDTTKILAAITVASAAGGGEVFFPPGTYLYTGSSGGNFLTIPSNVHLRGSGKDVTILLLGSVSGLSNACIATAENSENCGIFDMTLDGNNRGTQAQTAIYIYPGSQRTIVRDVLIKDHYSSLGNLYIADAQFSLIDNVVIEGATDSFEHLFRVVATNNGDNGSNTISNCTGKNGGFAFSVVKSSRNDFINCGAYADNLDYSLEGFNCDGGQFNNFINCKAVSRGDAGYIETDDSAGGRPRGNRVIGFTADGNKLNGFGIDGSEGVYSGLIIKNNGQGGSGLGQTFGVYCSANSTSYVISDVFSYDDQTVKTQTHGFLIESGATGIHYSNVQGYGNSTALIEDRNTVNKAGRIKFHAHNNNVDISISTSTFTKITFTTPLFNTLSFYKTTDGKFQPTKAGIYSLHAQASFESATAGMQMTIEIRKNGSTFKWFIGRANGTGNQSIQISALCPSNGTTDYFELYVYQDSGGTLALAGEITSTYFEGYLLDD